jgi:hypothetical protein
MELPGNHGRKWRGILATGGKSMDIDQGQGCLLTRRLRPDNPLFRSRHYIIIDGLGLRQIGIKIWGQEQGMKRGIYLHPGAAQKNSQHQNQHQDRTMDIFIKELFHHLIISQRKLS